MKFFSLLHILIALTALHLSAPVFAKNYVFSFLNKKERSLKSILGHFTDKQTPYDDQQKHVKLIKKHNPAINNWERIPPGSTLKLYVPEELANKDKIISSLKNRNPRKPSFTFDLGPGLRIRNDRIKTSYQNLSLQGWSYQSFHFSGTYMSSEGISFSTSGRYSSFGPIDIKDSENNSIRLKPDYDISLRLGKAFGFSQASTIFGGLMSSRFSSFDAVTFEDTEALEQITSNILFGILGGRHVFKLEDESSLGLELVLFPVLTLNGNGRNTGKGYRYQLATDYSYNHRIGFFGIIDSHNLDYGNQELTSWELTLGSKVKF